MVVWILACASQAGNLFGLTVKNSQRLPAKMSVHWQTKVEGKLSVVWCLACMLSFLPFFQVSTLAVYYASYAWSFSVEARAVGTTARTQKGVV